MKALDPVTRLPSAPSFFLALELAATEAQLSGARLSVLVVDTDRLQSLRERDGDEPADAALALLSKVLRLALGPVAILARLAGEQFGVMLRFTHIEDAHRQADALRRAIELAFLSHQRRLTVSIGVACGPDSGDWTGQELIGLASRRRDVARTAGGNCVQAHGYPGMRDGANRHWPSFGGIDRPIPHEQLTLF